MALYYKEYGMDKSPLMVFIHGGGVSGWMWDKQVNHFSTNFHCLVPDLPEHGQSKGNSLFTIHSSAERIIDLMEEKGKGKPVIAIGFSLGAQVLIAMLGMKPDVADYAMINSALVKPIPFSRVIVKMLAFSHPLIKNKTFSNIQAKSMYIPESYFDIYYEESCQMSKDTFMRVMEENMSFTIPNNFENATGHILATVGEKEKKIMKQSMSAIVDSHPNCEGMVIPGMGHGFSLADPEGFHQLVENWLNEQ